MSLTDQPADRHVALRGQTLVLFALFLVVLIGSAALTIDYGTWLKSKRDYQNAADTAALQGATFLVKPINVTKQGQARRAAWNSLNRQLNLGVPSTTIDTWVAAGNNGGAAQTSGGYRMWVSTSPNGAGAKYPGAQGANASAVFVYVEKNGRSFLSSIFGQADPNVGAWATAASGPNRFAVITLRKNGDPTNGNPTDIDVNGGTLLKVSDGDLGGNWSMSINGVGSKIQFTSSSSDTYGPYLTENAPSPATWTASQVVDGSNSPVPVNYIPEVPDPNYPAPCLTYSVGGTTCLEDRAVAGFPPNATTDRSGDTCPVGATVDRLPSGRYTDIKIPNGKCLVLDPLLLPVAGKYNGIYYITGTLDINNSGLLIGNGVTLVFARGADLNMNAGASISLNSGAGFGSSSCTPQCKYGGWTSKGGYQWSTGVAPTYNGVPADLFAKGIAMYVCKSTGACDAGGTASTNIVQLSSGSGLDYLGLVYAPYDNVKFSGQPTHKDIGQLVAWTVMFTGGVEIDQTYAGPDSGTPYLIEPNTSQ